MWLRGITQCPECGSPGSPCCELCSARALPPARGDGTASLSSPAGTLFPRGNKCLRLLVGAGAHKEIPRVSRGCLLPSPAPWSRCRGVLCSAWPPCTLLINVLVVPHVEMAHWDGLERKQGCAKDPWGYGACDGVTLPARHPRGCCSWLGEKGCFRSLRCWEHPLSSQH